MIQQSIRQLLSQLENLLSALSAEEYATALPILKNGSVGQHVRHVIELFQSLLQGYESGTVNYDKRKRDLVLEINQSAAAAQLAGIAAAIVREDKGLFVAGNYSAQGDEEMMVKSSFYRELIYNMEHTIHHMAIIRIAIQQTTAIALPDDFGMAASTLRHKKACAQ